MSPRATINPYLTATGLVGRRLKWDLNPLAHASRTRLKAERNSHAGGTAVILCNGPSLLDVDFAMLERSKVFLFGLNKINLLMDETGLVPNAIVAVNPHVIRQNLGFFAGTSVRLYLDSHASSLIGWREHVTYLHSTSIGKFARDCSISVNQGGTVTYVALQLAFHLGFAKVALVGCDHQFAGQSGPANAEVQAIGPDRNHFHKDYFSAGAAWHLPDLALSELHYHLARRAFEEAGRTVVNCTSGGRLEVFPRASLADFLKRNA